MLKSRTCRSTRNEGGLDYLTKALADIRRSSCHAHDRRVDRLAISFVPQGPAELDDVAITLDEFRMVALSFRWCGSDRDGMLAREPLAVYRAEADLGGTGRIRFVCQRAHDLRSRTRGIALSPRAHSEGCREGIVLHQTIEDAPPAAYGADLHIPRFYYAFLPKQPPVFEATYRRAVWEDPTVWMRIGTLRAWPAAMFVRPRGHSFEVNPIDQTPNPWATGELTATEEEQGSWVLREGVAYPRAQRPDAIYAVFPPELHHRMIRSPAWSVLRSHGVLDDGRGHRAWLDVVSRQFEGIRHYADPSRPESRTGQVRAAIEAHLSAESGRQETVMADLGDACEALGITLPRGVSATDDFLVDLLDSPWLSVDAPGQGTIQLIVTARDAPTLHFSDGTVEVDLDDLGSHSQTFASLPRYIVREALYQRFGRGHGTSSRNQGSGRRQRASQVVTAAGGHQVKPVPPSVAAHA